MFYVFLVVVVVVAQRLIEADFQKKEGNKRNHMFCILLDIQHVGKKEICIGHILAALENHRVVSSLDDN